MSTEIKTLIKVDNKFININDFTGIFPDEFYIDGAIICKINDKVLLDLQHWDYVDQLWSYILQGLEALLLENFCNVGFPDQPLQFTFRAVNSRVVEVALGNSKLKFERTIFFRTLALEAESFFLRMIVLLPKAKPTWEIELDRVNKIMASLR